MDRNNNIKLFNTFLKIFILLLIILLIMPFIFDRAMLFLNKGGTPGNNSIIVFKDLVEEHKAMARFLETFKKLINSM